MTFLAPSAKSRLRRAGPAGQFVNQIGSLLGNQTIGKVLRTEGDTEQLTVPCSTIGEIAKSLLPPTAATSRAAAGTRSAVTPAARAASAPGGLDVLYIDVEGFEFWVLADLLKRRPMTLRPRMIVYEHKIMEYLRVYSDKDVQFMLANAGYFTGVETKDNTRAIRLDVLMDALTDSCGSAIKDFLKSHGP